MKIVFIYNSDQVLATCGEDEKIILSSTTTGKQLFEFEDIPASKIQFSKSTTHLAAGCFNGKVKIFDLKMKKICNNFS